MTVVDTGEVTIVPTFNRFRSQVTAEVESVGAESGNRFTSAFKGAIGGVAATLAAVGFKDFVVSGIKDASDLEQSVGAVGSIFKENAGQINSWADSASTDLGLTKNEFNTLGSLIGAQLKNGGTAMDQLAPKTNDLIGLGADLSSMFGGDTTTAVEALSSALKGERDPIEKYGVSLSQAKIDAEAAALGFEKVGGSLSSEANQAATLSLIMKQTADAHGNFASESDTLAGKQQRLNAMWKDGKTAIVGAFAPAVSSVTSLLLDKLPGAIRVALYVVNGFVAGLDSFTSAWRANDGVVTKSGFSGFMQQTAAIVRPIFTEIKGGITAFGAAWKANDGDVTSSGFPGFMEKLAFAAYTAFDTIKTAFGDLGKSFQTGDFSTLGDTFSGFLAIAQPAGPIIAEVGKAVAGMSGTIGELVAGALPLLEPILKGATGVMQFLADNTNVLTAVIIGITSAIVIFKAAQAAANLAEALSLPIKAAEVASNFALASAIRANTAATGVQIATERRGLVGRAISTAGIIGQTVANVASRAAQIAGAAATGVATAAQWLFNAALSANPIALIVIAIAALVAGLIFFFTQTELGQQIWANFMSFLTDAWNNIVAVAQVVWQFLADVIANVWAFIVTVVTTYINMVQAVVLAVVGFIVTAWQTSWQFISDVITNVWNFIVAFVTAYIQLVSDIITNVIAFISAAWNAAWQFISDVISNVWTFIVAFITTYINTVRDIIANVIAFITSIWQAGWNNASRIISTVWNAITSFINGAVNGIAGAISGFVNNVSSGVQSVLGFITGLPGKILSILGDLGNLLVSSGQDLFQGFINGIRGMIGDVGNAIGDVMSTVTDFFPHSPAKRGPFSGSGWTRVKTAGLAIGNQLTAGVEASKTGVQSAMDKLATVSGVTTGVSTASVAAAGVGTTDTAPRVVRVVFDGLVAFKEQVQMEIEYADGVVERQIMSGSV